MGAHLDDGVVSRLRRQLVTRRARGLLHFTMMLAADQRTVALVLAHHARVSRRLRVEISSLFGNAELARSAHARSDVVRAVANPRSGRMLIEYTSSATIADELAALAPGRRSAGTYQQAAWHAEPVEIVAARLDTEPYDGLSIAEAARRLETLGANANR